MPTKKQDDAAYWDARRSRLLTPNPMPLAHPAVLPSEDPAEHAALVAEYYARFNPTRPEERGYVDDIIYCEWLLRRFERTEWELNVYIHENCGHTHEDFPLGQPAVEKYKVFNALQWRIISTRKALKENLAALRDLRAHPIPDPPPAPKPVTETKHTSPPRIGFVFGDSPDPVPGSTGSPTVEPLPPAPPHAT